MQVECFKLKLKPGTLTLAREWAARLNSESDEVKKLLEKEGMQLESVFLEQSSAGDFLVYYLRAPDLKLTHERAKASQHPIDVFHREMLARMVESVHDLECLLDVSTI